MPVVARFNVTPVKGTALHHPDHVTLTPNGIPEDRRFFLVDADGALFSGSDHGPLVQVRADFDDEKLTCTFPSGETVAAQADVLGDARVVDFYGRPVAAHEVRGPFSDAFSTHVGAPVRLLRADRGGDALDVHPVTLVGLASVSDLGRRGGHAGDLDPRRFRINIEIDGTEPYEEDTWDGRTVAIGEAVVRVAGQIPRCVVTTQDPDSGVHDWNTLKKLGELRPPMRDGAGVTFGVPFGMYAQVDRAGDVPRSGEVALLPF
jgi:uncharacterized protein YcbX